MYIVGSVLLQCLRVCLMRRVGMFCLLHHFRIFLGIMDQYNITSYKTIGFIMKLLLDTYQRI